MTPSEFKEWGLALAEVSDAHRPFPRIMMGIFFCMLIDTHFWFKSLSTTPDLQMWYAGAVLALLAGTTKFYVDSGRRWEK